MTNEFKNKLLFLPPQHLAMAFNLLDNSSDLETNESIQDRSSAMICIINNRIPTSYSFENWFVCIAYLRESIKSLHL